MDITSWNVNGIRSVQRQGFSVWLRKQSPDILCLQEIKARADQIPTPLLEVEGYHSYHSCGQRKGYSGVITYTKQLPKQVVTDTNYPILNAEGRFLQLDFSGFTLLNVYCPNGNSSPQRLNYKLKFYDALLNYTKELLAKRKEIILCTDLNTAHTPDDVYNYKAKTRVSGFLPQERQWIDKLLEAGLVDSFRLFTDGPEHHTWWSFRTGYRQANKGWRYDYIFISQGLKKKVKTASILKDVTGSDHCPISIDVDQ